MNTHDQVKLNQTDGGKQGQNIYGQSQGQN